VEVDDAVDALVVVLVAHVVAHGAHVVPEVALAARLDAGETRVMGMVGGPYGGGATVPRGAEERNFTLV
jgi:hypothetical protein